MLYLTDTAGAEGARDGQGEELKLRAVGYLGLLHISSKEDHARMKKQAMPNHLPRSQLHTLPPVTPGTTQTALFTWSFPSNQDTSSTTAKPYVLSPSLE